MNILPNNNRPLIRRDITFVRNRRTTSRRDVASLRPVQRFEADQRAEQVHEPGQEPALLTDVIPRHELMEVYG